MIRPDEIPPTSQNVHASGLYTRHLGANVVGFFTIFFLNILTPLEAIRVQRSFLISEGGWVYFLAFFPVTLCLVFLFQHHLQRPIIRQASQLKRGISPVAKELESGKTSLLNLPYALSLSVIVVYMVVPALILGVFRFLRDLPWIICFFLYFRTIMVGLLAALLSFFLIENRIRQTLIPLFFPKGRVSTQTGSIKISILRRIRLLNGAGTISPMILLVITFLFIWWERVGIGVGAALFRDVLIFTAVLCALFIIIVYRLNFLVGDSILKPIADMLDVIETVKQGDFSRKIRVCSNDELGILGDAGNNMIQGLADREIIRETFGKYVSPEIRDRILSGEIPLSGERRIATLLFSDLRNFTSYVEENRPEEVIRSMRDYFSAMEAVIRRHQGLVLQYVGDEIEAVFGVPLSSDRHADDAVQTALEMRGRLQELNEKRMGQGKPSFNHGIGIYTGMVLAGNTGSEERLSYTLIGNTVNLASRIEQLTKALNCDILISEETVKQLHRSFDLKKEPPQEVKGFSRPVCVFQIR